MREETFTIRHYAPEQDLSTLSRLLTEIESVDRDGEETSEEYLRSMLTWPNFDSDQDVWVAEVNSKLVGFGQIYPRGDETASIYIVVHPAQRRQGLGSQLLQLVLSRAEGLRSKRVLVYANAKNTASNRFLKHYGFDLAGTSGGMVAQVASLPQAQIPAGYSVRRYPELNDPQIVLQALNECYRDMVGHHQNVSSADRFMHYFGEEGIHLLFDEGQKLIGICTGKSQGKTDERGVSHLLDAPGLVKEYRRKDLQRFLALAVMNWLREQGAYPITLEYWGDDENTLDIYRGLGFNLVNQQMTYQRELT